MTDPAEWQDKGLGDTSIKRDLSLITDPPEPEADMGAMKASSHGMTQHGKLIFAQAMGQFLVQSIRAGGKN